MSPPTMRAVAAGSVALATLLAIACAGDRADSRRATTEVVDPGQLSDDLAGQTGTEPRPIDEALMIALAQAKNFHHKADVYLQDGRVEQAEGAVQQVLTVQFPAASPEGEDVHLDARARLAKLQLARGDLDAAEQTVAAGIDNATRRSFFVANLHTVRGEILEARAAAADEAEDAEAARALRRSAIEALDTSIAINRDLQRALVGELP